MTIHETIKNQFSKALEKGTISHALLLDGKAGFGTLPLAKWMAKQLLCSNQNDSCVHKVDSLQHPDLHFCYPVASAKDTSLTTYQEEWIQFNKETPYGSLFEWMELIASEKKQGGINVSQINEIIHVLNLNSYEGGNKVMLIWNADTMNTQSANKLLKILEEPPKKTFFILITEHYNELLPTITSRCQRIQVPRLSEAELASILFEKYEIDQATAEQFAKSAYGDMAVAVEQIESKTEEFEELFIDWVRYAFMAKSKLSALQKIHEWSMNIGSWNSREKQKLFLTYCIDIFRQALLQNYGSQNLVNMPLQKNNFKWESFAQYIHGANIEAILQEINEAHYHIERNALGKLVFLDLAIKMTRHLHTRETA
ncbi:DNA polymerase III subunit delta' [Ornithobacterium rhinotracheale]|uniref:DNA polymerase III subunit delta n=1 Tax=Ornithobacterium rhinotracheale TaxID=28251 RepID=A0A410JPZ2_ORNRH|nr:DNA polymerase III subunit delta' [Ornithobacterium rhinotracheale]QAR30209.1 DNA polymerase III subunit delta' [Ornithobacterium rhinotracheale]